jgi:hypothetical protein
MISRRKAKQKGALSAEAERMDEKINVKSASVAS